LPSRRIFGGFPRGDGRGAHALARDVFFFVLFGVDYPWLDTIVGLIVNIPGVLGVARWRRQTLVCFF